MTQMNQEIRTDFSILICTRNRSDILKKCLESISHSSLIPNSIIIVATGEDVLSVLETFRPKLKIEYFHIDGFGQIHQKMFGITKVPKEAEWLLFLDEDLEIDRDCFSNLFKTLENDLNPDSIVGIGLADQSSRHIQTTDKLSSSRSRAGRILKNAKNVNYMHVDEPIDTDWLNGASMWRKHVLFNYHFDHTNTKYAACEDLIFSYQARKHGRLVFSPNSLYRELGKHNATLSAFQLRSIGFWKYYFITKTSEFSKSLFLLSFTITTVRFFLRKNVIAEKLYAAKTLAILIKSIVLKMDATQRLQDLEL